MFIASTIEQLERIVAIELLCAARRSLLDAESAKTGAHIRDGVEEFPIPNEIGRSPNPISERFVATRNADGDPERRGGGLEGRREL